MTLDMKSRFAEDAVLELKNVLLKELPEDDEKDRMSPDEESRSSAPSVASVSRKAQPPGKLVKLLTHSQKNLCFEPAVSFLLHIHGVCHSEP